MKTVGVQFISICDCDVKTLLIKLPTFYEVCLKYFADTSVANQWSAQKPSDPNLSKINYLIEQ